MPETFRAPAAPAREYERGSVGEVADGARALAHRGKEDADRAGIRVAVGVAADLPIHGADVQAGGAAQARERLAQRPIDLRNPTAVEQHEMEFLGTLEL